MTKLVLQSDERKPKKTKVHAQTFHLYIGLSCSSLDEGLENWKVCT